MPKIKPDDKEKRVKDVVRSILRSHGVYYFMPPANGFGRSGVPDFVGCVRGRFFGVECKAPSRSGNVSSLQAMEGKEIIKRGGMWMVVYDDESAYKLEEWIVMTTLEKS